MARRRPREASEQQHPLPSPPPKTKRPDIHTPEQIEGSIRRRAKPSAVPGNVKRTMTFDIPRKLAEQLTAQAVREGVNLETVIERLMRAEAE